MLLFFEDFFFAMTTKQLPIPLLSDNSVAASVEVKLFSEARCFDMMAPPRIIL